jgi:hypothetical protein
MYVVIRKFGNVRSVSEVGPAQDQQILFWTLRDGVELRDGASLA